MGVVAALKLAVVLAILGVQGSVVLAASVLLGLTIAVAGAVRAR